MRDYLSPAKRYASRVLLDASGLRTLLTKRWAFVFATVAAFVVIITLVFLTVRGVMHSGLQQDAVTVNRDSAAGTTVTTVTSDQPAVATEQSQNGGVTTPPSSSHATTSVTVNNQPIDVPANGSVHKEIDDGNGNTTHVDISSSSGTSGSSFSSSVSSTNLNMSTNTVSQNVSSSTQ